jgi:heme-degrading monooxygenase HmoA
MSPDRIDDATRQLREEQLPQFKEQQGYKGFTVMADRGSGNVVGVTFWESEDALQQSEEVGNQARRTAAETGGASAEPQVERYEVLLDDMV